MSEIGTKKTPESLGKTIFFWPSKNLSMIILIVLVLGFIVGLAINTAQLKSLLLPVTILVIYPTMIGFKPKEVLNLSHGRLIIVVTALNFLVIPVVAYLLGISFLLKDPQLFAGLAITALLPTSNMTIAFSMLAKGNVPAAIKLTTMSLLIGAVLAPWYLLVMVGKYVPVDILLTLRTISMVIVLPLILGLITYSWLLKKYTVEHFQKKIKPYLPATSAWGMAIIIFISISMNAPRIATNLDVFLVAFLVILVFYAVNYLMAILIGRSFFEQKDALTLVFSTVLRNLSISIGLAATAFGPNAALMVSLAFLIQGQAAAGFIKLNQKYGLLTRKRNLTTGTRA